MKFGNKANEARAILSTLIFIKERREIYDRVKDRRNKVKENKDEKIKN
jgi:hypothetical protein